MSKNAAILFARSKQDFRTVEKTDVDGMVNIYEGHSWDTCKKDKRGVLELLAYLSKNPKFNSKLLQCIMVPLLNRMLLWSKFPMYFGQLLQEHIIQN